MSKLSVSISMTYVRRCEECVGYARQTVSAALYDGQVTSISLKAVDRCEHETAKDAALVSGFRAEAARVRAVGGSSSAPTSAVAPNQTGLLDGLETSGAPNGFDSEMM